LFSPTAKATLTTQTKISANSNELGWSLIDL